MSKGYQTKKPILAWWFSAKRNRLNMGDQRTVVKEGVTLREPYTELCQRGLHASTNIIDALSFGKGSFIWRVELSGRVVRGTSKIVATERKHLWCVNGESLLRDFARRSALDVAHLWYAPDVVVRFLKTGDEKLRRDDAEVARMDWPRPASHAAYTSASHAAGDDSPTFAAYAARIAAAAASMDATAATTAKKKQAQRLTQMVHAQHRKQQQ